MRPNYSWLVVFAAFLTKFLGPSLGYSSGVFFVALMEKYDDISLISWISSIFNCMFVLIGPFGSYVINTLDCRRCVFLAGLCGVIGFGTSYVVADAKLLLLTYSLVAGIGTGLAQSGCMTVIAYYFPKNSSIVAGLTTCGSGIGIFVHPILLRFLLDEYGLSGGFLLMGGVMFHLCICGMMMRPSPTERRKRTEKKPVGRLSCREGLKEYTEIIKNPSFLLFSMSLHTYSIAIITLYIYLPDYFYQNGASLTDSSLAISASGIGSIASRLLGGLAGNDAHVGSDILYSCLPSLMGVLSLFLYFFNRSSAGRITFGFLIGLYMGAPFVMINPITLNIVGIDRFATGFGIEAFLTGIGALIGPPIAGRIFQSSGDYHHVFIFSAAMQFATTLCAFGSMLTRKPVAVDNEDNLSVSIPEEVHQRKSLTVDESDTDV